MVHRRILLSIFCASGTFVVAFLSAQQSDEVKERPLEIRKADAPESPTPAKSASPTKKKKTSPTPTAKPKPHATPKETPDEESSPSPSASPHKKKKSASESPNDSASPKKKKKKASPSPTKKKSRAAKKEKAKPAETPSPKPSASIPHAVAVPSPSAPPTARSTSSVESPATAEEPEQLTIEKYGYEKPKSFWQRVFGGGGRSTSSGAGYRYLTRSVRDAIDRASPDRRNPRWQLIVVHNSGTRQGNARVFDYYHKHVRHMQNGLAYHFVIGNGTSTGNGQIEIGDRWRRQINGGHVHSDYLNNIAVGICLVGDFNRDQPTRAQLDCCEELVRYLRQRCGKIDNHFPLVKPHREVNPPRWGTDCPGDVFPYSWFRRFRE